MPLYQSLIAFPLELNAFGEPKIVADRAGLVARLIKLFSTPLGSYRPLPDYGLDIQVQQFEYNDDQFTSAMFQTSIRRSLEKFEPGLEVEAVEVLETTEEGIELLVDILELNTGETISIPLVYPLYTEISL
jgi:phage baseplate assembly protein W